MTKLRLDFETFSSVNLKTCGVHKYVASPDFEILLIAYAFNDEPVKILDLASGEKMPRELINALDDTKIIKTAYNAQFERLCLKYFAQDAKEWRCTMAKAAYCGLPFGLGNVANALGFPVDRQKDTAGKRLIQYFCVPCKPTKANGFRSRNLPEHDPEKWRQFKQYCIQDVVVEKAIDKALEAYKIPAFEQETYNLDQKINDRGVLLDLDLVNAAIKIDEESTNFITNNLFKITGLQNVNSPTQIRQWLNGFLVEKIQTLRKEDVSNLLADKSVVGHVRQVLEGRAQLSKTSVKKYAAMLNYAGLDNRARGLFMYYGANRTGRFAGRGIQLQNLVRNFIKGLDLARQTIKKGDYELAAILYDNIPDVLSQLIRTAFVASPGKTLGVIDFSAIEARVIAWLAGEQWRLDVFASHGKIYEASASKMFNVPLDRVDKDLRQKGKVAELALGYQGGVGALVKMGGEKMGLTEPEMKQIVTLWRQRSPAIVALWSELERCALQAVLLKKPVICKNKGLIFDFDGKALTVQLPSGRKLFYWGAKIKKGKFDKNVVSYKGMEQTTKKWETVDTYGGKLAENITQAIARDCLTYSMLNLDKYAFHGFDIVIHVHDEIVCELPENTAHTLFITMQEILSSPIKWAQGLRLTADGYLTNYYKKD
jgi:DNA polymerase bacteriophage-type